MFHPFRIGIEHTRNLFFETFFYENAELNSNAQMEREKNSQT